MRWTPLASLVLVAGSASAAPIYELPTTEYTFKADNLNASATAFRVIAPTPVLTAILNSVVAWSAGIEGVARSTDWRDMTCEATVTTTAFVSWVCGGTTWSPDGGGGSARLATAMTYFVEGDGLRPAKLEQLFGSDAKKRLASLPGHRRSDAERTCTPDVTFDFYVSADGVTFVQYEQECTIGWTEAHPLLLKDSILRRVFDADGSSLVLPAPENPKAAWAKAQPRFVSQDGGVVDRATDLMWAVRDNGADIDHAGAVAFAAAYTAGPYDDWRLPTEGELEALSDPADAHRDRKDCTRGKNALLVTPKIQLTCGLAWSSSTPSANKNPIAFGFISGTPRVAKPTDKKNLRALVVRDVTPPAPPAKTK